MSDHTDEYYLGIIEQARLKIAARETYVDIRFDEDTIYDFYHKYHEYIRLNKIERKRIGLD